MKSGEKVTIIMLYKQNNMINYFHNNCLKKSFSQTLQTCDPFLTHALSFFTWLPNTVL